MLWKRIQQLALFLVSLFGGLVIGLVILGTGYWLLTATTLGTQLQNLVGFTDQTPWYLSRASGTVAYLILTASTFWGLLLTTKAAFTLFHLSGLWASHSARPHGGDR